MKQFCIILFIIISTSCFAQTKLIAFKSHSGNMDNFNISLENELFNEEGSNFGNPPYKKIYHLDSIIYISESVSVLVKREYQYPWNGSKDSAEFIKTTKDTLLNDPVFTKKHSLDNIRHLLKKQLFYEYDTKNTILVGYDKKKTIKKKDNNGNNTNKKNSIAFIVTTNKDPGNNSPFDVTMLKALAVIFLFAILGGWLSAKFYTLRLQKA
jgi:hypothetical protein